MYDFSPHLQQVAAFHRACHHPIGDVPHPLSPERMTIRLTWALDELFEFALAADDVDRIDALNDCAYFLGGTLVEMGVFHFLIEMRQDAADVPAFLRQMTRLCMAGVTQDGLTEQVVTVRDALSCLLAAHAAYPLDFATAFGCVHDGNMTKRWPDGLPHHDPHDAGKILKPPTWQDPKQRVAAYFATLAPRHA